MKLVADRWLRRVRSGPWAAPVEVLRIATPGGDELLACFPIDPQHVTGFDLGPGALGARLACLYYRLRAPPDGTLLAARYGARWGLLLDSRWARLNAPAGLRVRLYVPA